MNGDDLESFTDYLGFDSEITWAIAERVAESLVFYSIIPCFARYPFVGACMELLEEDAYLELFGCLDAPV